MKVIVNPSIYRLYRDLSSRLERKTVLAPVRVYHVALFHFSAEDQLGQVVLKLPLHCAFQRPGAVERIVAHIDQVGLCPVAYLQLYLLLMSLPFKCLS